jgi:predicted Zn-dependent protease
MLTKEQAQRLTEKVLKLSKFPECNVDVSESEQAFIRFANNGVTTSGFTVIRTVTVASTRDNKTGSTQTTEFDDAALEAAVRRSEEMALLAPPNPERVPPLGPQKYGDYDNWDDRTANARGPEMAPHVKAVIDAAVAKRLVAAGFISRSGSAGASANKRGNFVYQRSTDSRMATTVRTPTGTSSGWAGQPAVHIAEINGADLGSRAVDKCLRWAGKPARLEPGKYTVLLEPTAVADLVQVLGFFGTFAARSADEGRSFLSKKGGGTHLGDKFFPEIITLRSDPSDRRLPAVIAGPDGLPTRPITWIEKGVVKNLAYDRYWAIKTGNQPTPSGQQLILDGQKGSVGELLKGVERGLLVTRFWYIRSVNPQTVQLTGLTRDGLFLIENGAISHPVINFRFNESPVRLLQNTIALGTPQRARGGEGFGMLAPPLVATDFLFSSISDAI